MVTPSSTIGSSNLQSHLNLHIVYAETNIWLKNNFAFLDHTNSSVLLEQRVMQQPATGRVVALDRPHTNPPRSASRNPNFRRRLPPASGVSPLSITTERPPMSNGQLTPSRRTASFLLHGRVDPLIDHHEINRRQRRSSLGPYQTINNNETTPNLRFPPLPRSSTLPPPPPPPSPPPPATPMNWLDGSTRKEQYESVDKANKGLRGLCKKILRKCGVKTDEDDIEFYEEGKEDTGTQSFLSLFASNPIVSPNPSLFMSFVEQTLHLSQ